MVGDIIKSDSENQEKYAQLMDKSGNGVLDVVWIGDAVFRSFKDNGEVFFVEVDAGEPDQSDPRGNYRKYKYAGDIIDPRYTDL